MLVGTGLIIGILILRWEGTWVSRTGRGPSICGAVADGEPRGPGGRLAAAGPQQVPGAVEGQLVLSGLLGQRIGLTLTAVFLAERRR
jgi:hypothetical protein